MSESSPLSLFQFELMAEFPLTTLEGDCREVKLRRESAKNQITDGVLSYKSGGDCRQVRLRGTAVWRLCTVHGQYAAVAPSEKAIFYHALRTKP